MKRLIFPFALALTLFAAFPVFAAGIPTQITLTNAAFTRCAGSVIEGTLGATVYDDEGAVMNSGSPITLSLRAALSDGSTAVESWDYTAGSGVAFAFTTVSGTVTQVSITLVASNGTMSQTITYGCNGSITFGSTGGGGGGMDRRLNYYYCDLTSALYSTANGIEVWDIGEDSTGDYKGAYSKADVAEFVDAPPSVNTYIGRIGRTTAEVLTTGEIQIKIDEDAEKKSCTIILDAIPPTSVYFR